MDKNQGVSSKPESVTGGSQIPVTFNTEIIAAPMLFVF